MKACYLCVLFLSIVISSCSQQEQEINAPREQVKDELILSLENLNDSIMATKPQSRSFLRFLAVSAADIGGAWELGKIGATVGSAFPGYGTLIGGGVGAVVGGVGASYVAYCSTCSIVVPYNYDVAFVAAEYAKIKESVEINECFDEQIKLEIPQKYEEALLVGAEHNLILDALRADSVITRSEPMNMENTTSPSLSTIETQVLNSSGFVDRYNSLMQTYCSLDVEKYVSDNNSMGSQVVRLFIDVYNQYSETIDDVNLIINKYIQRIESSSSLTNDEKQLIYNALAVAAYSFRYWDNEYSCASVEN